MGRTEVAPPIERVVEVERRPRLDPAATAGTRCLTGVDESLYSSTFLLPRVGAGADALASGMAVAKALSRHPYQLAARHDHRAQLRRGAAALLRGALPPGRAEVRRGGLSPAVVPEENFTRPGGSFWRETPWLKSLELGDSLHGTKKGRTPGGRRGVRRRRFPGSGTPLSGSRQQVRQGEKGSAAAVAPAQTPGCGN
jgi:hypothetical protein